MLRTKEKELFSDSLAWTPWQKFLQIRAGTYNHGSIAYRVCDIPIKGLWASSARMRPLTCHLSHHSLDYKRLSCCWVGKGEGLRTAKFNYDNLIISADPQDDPRNHMRWVKWALFMFLVIETHNEFGIPLQHTFRLGCAWKIISGHLYTLAQHSWGNKKYVSDCTGMWFANSLVSSDS